MYKFSIPDPTSVSNISDWVELYVTINKTEISKSELKGFIEESVGKETTYGRIDSVWAELERRKLLYGDHAPFDFEGSTTLSSNISWENYPAYVACLIFSLYGNYEDPQPDGRLFEKICSEAIKYYVGGESIISGRGTGSTNPKVQKIAEAMNEIFSEEPAGHYKDRGADLFVWKPFGDNRGGQIVLIVQCTASKNWKDKLNDLVINPWEKYIKWHGRFVKAFSLAQVVPENRFKEDSWTAGILIDRPRIYKCTINPEFNPELKEELKKWCNRKIEGIKV